VVLRELLCLGLSGQEVTVPLVTITITAASPPGLHTPTPAVMNINKKFDRLKQWTNEKMGAEARTGLSDEFKALEVEMNLRHEGLHTRWPLQP